ncbi:MAG: hypothetical protein HY044_01250 [Candidatus Woesebacteria bacterium]|nr:MAG: hypothetical protein HY044_01250 [Candidatus Woesebacteria bacterium]
MNVLYFYDPPFKAGYDKLIKMYPSVNFVLRYDFKIQLLELIKNGTDYIFFLVDDDVMINPFQENCPEFNEFKKNPDILTLSLRMAPNYRYKNQPILKSNKWEWRPYAKGGNLYNHRLRNWGYPMAVGGHIFKREDILTIIEVNDMKNPNFLEGALWANPPNRSLTICFDKPKIINNIANQVQTDFPSHITGISVEELEKRFLNGERLSILDIKKKATTAKDCYLRGDYKWEYNS